MSRASLGFVVLSGMVAATVAGVVFVPVLYSVVERVSGGGRSGLMAGGAAHVPEGMVIMPNERPTMQD